MTLEQQLRDRLGTVDVPPSRLDVGNVLAAGRRADRRRTVQVAAGTVLVMGALVALPSVVFGSRGTQHATPTPNQSATAGPPPSGDCTLTKLPVPRAMKNLSARGVDPTGRYIIGVNVSGKPGPKSDPDSADRSQDAQPVLWTDGKVKTLPAPHRSIRLTGVNAGGVVVGLAGDTVNDTVWRWVDGQPQKLRNPAGSWDFSYAFVNAPGDVVATGDTGVLVWRAGSTTATKLPLETGAEVRAFTDDGTLIGQVVSLDRTKVTAYTWTLSGAATKLTAPDGRNVEIFTARGDWVTARIAPAGAAVRWNRKTGHLEDLRLPFPANGINGHGWVVSQDVLVKDTGPVGLTDPTGDFTAPSDIADNGLIVGILNDYQTQNPETGEPDNQPVTWTCR
ncbi:hypothetical protein AB0M54_33640 [Actinoplanes sp. NPDC051470]|uniref:hypothetical protein n=1 Tax=Actinoplanes sp. NPDC051470 TaxID=3157224 RepID=UPI00342FC443